MKTTHTYKYLINEKICKIPMPIDLYKAYGSYRYGIFKEGNPYKEDQYYRTGLLNKEYDIYHSKDYAGKMIRYQSLS